MKHICSLVLLFIIITSSLFALPDITLYFKQDPILKIQNNKLYEDDIEIGFVKDEKIYTNDDSHELNNQRIIEDLNSITVYLSEDEETTYEYRFSKKTGHLVYEANNHDKDTLYDYLMGKSELYDECLLASDLNSDGIINTLDLLAIHKAINSQ